MTKSKASSRKTKKQGSGEIQAVGPEITDLPFVKDTKSGRDFWAVQATGDHFEDGYTGNQYAAYALDFLSKIDDDTCNKLLIHCVNEMPRGNDITQIEVGFFEIIERQIVRCLKNRAYSLTYHLGSLSERNNKAKMIMEMLD